MSYDGSENALKIYLRDISQTPLLTIEEEIALAERIKNGDESAREQMIRANLRLVVKIAQDYANYGVPILDLISEGNIGLMKAVERFDPNKGGKLSTYGSWWIKQSIRRALSNQSKTIRLPVHVVDKIAKIRKIATVLTEALGREPTHEELAEEVGVPVNKIQDLFQSSQRPVSLDAPINDGETTEYSEIISDEHAEDPSDILSHKNMHGEITGLLDILEPRERQIIEERFGLNGYLKPLTLEEVGAELGVTRERIRQLQNIAIGKMQRALRRKEKSSPRVSPQESASKRVATIITTLSSLPSCPEVLNILQKSEITTETKEIALRNISAGKNMNWYSLSIKALRELRKTKADIDSHKKITYTDIETFLRATVFSVENSLRNTRKRR